MSLTMVAEPESPAATPTTAAPRRRRLNWSNVAPSLLVALPVIFNLWVLRSERLVVSYPNDSQTHLQMVQWATSMLSHGLLPFDHWYPHLSLGSPFFVQYQSLSAVLAGALGLVVGAQTSYAWTLYLLLALWPLCVFWTGRLLGWGRWESSIAAVISPLLFSITGRGFEDQAFTWLGSGLWSELWAMWSLPLAIGFSWRFISRRQYLFGAVLFSALTIGFHFLMAYLIALVLLVLVFLRPSDLVRRLGRCATVGVCSLLASLWVTLPLLADAKWTAYNEFQKGTTIDNSYGAPKILDWLVTGRIYDFSRFPIVTILVAVGLVACVVKFRLDERARLLLAMWVLSLLLYFGRPTMSFAIDLLPGNKDLLFQRYIAGVHLAGLFLAGVGVVWLVELAGAAVRRSRPDLRARVLEHRWLGVGGAVLAIAVLLAVLAPAWSQVASYNSGNDAWIRYQQAADSTQGAQVDALLSLAAQRGGGRVYAGMPSNWGYDFKVGGVQVYIYMENSPVDAIGFTLRTFSLMTDPEAWFDQYNPGDYGVFGIRYLLLPAKMTPPVPATLLTTSGTYALWTVNSPASSRSWTRQVPSPPTRATSERPRRHSSPARCPIAPSTRRSPLRASLPPRPPSFPACTSRARRAGCSRSTTTSPTAGSRRTSSPTAPPWSCSRLVRPRLDRDGERRPGHPRDGGTSARGRHCCPRTEPRRLPVPRVRLVSAPFPDRLAHAARRGRRPLGVAPVPRARASWLRRAAEVS